INDPHHMRTAVSLHTWVDRHVEIPLFLIVLTTGAWLTMHAPMTALLSVKIAFALIAIAINVICAVAVRRRETAFASGNHAQVADLSRFIRLTFLGLVPGMIPLYIGATMFMARLPA
ncbi:MAG TPA: hypothetical protein VIT92_17160, partial [Burkholderiaceae bacterium]